MGCCRGLSGQSDWIRPCIKSSLSAMQTRAPLRPYKNYTPSQKSALFAFHLLMLTAIREVEGLHVTVHVCLKKEECRRMAREGVQQSQKNTPSGWGSSGPLWKNKVSNFTLNLPSRLLSSLIAHHCNKQAEKNRTTNKDKCGGLCSTCTDTKTTHVVTF